MDNHDLAKKINNLNGRFTKFRKEIRGDMELFKDSINSKLQPFHDFIVAHDAVNKDRGLRKPGGGFNRDKLVELLVQAIISALVIIGTLVTTKAI